MKTTAKTETLTQYIISEILQNYYDYEILESELDIYYNERYIGLLDYKIYENVISKGSYGDYSNIPEPAVVELELGSAILTGGEDDDLDMIAELNNILGDLCMNKTIIMSNY